MKNGLISSLAVAVMGWLVAATSDAQTRIATTSENPQCPALDYALNAVSATESRRQSFQLDNGLRVVLLPDEQASTVAIVTSVQVGARDEPDGETGYAHLFEHLMFRGSATVPDGGHKQLVTSVGGSFNAQTHYDYTNYYVTVPPEALTQMLWLEAQRFLSPNLSAETVASEIAAVHEEMALRIDNVPFMRSGSELLFKQLRSSDYDHLILGSSADLNAATPERLQDFYQRHYRPNRTILTVAGRFNVEQARAQIQREWSIWQPRDEATARAPLQLPDAQALEEQLVDSRAPWPALAFAWQTVPADHRDAAAVELIQQWLLRGEQAQLRQRLLQKNLLLQSAELPLEMPRLGLVNFIAVPRASAALSDLEQVVADTFANAAAMPPNPAQLCELKTIVLRRLITVAESPLSLAYRESIDQAVWQQSLLLSELKALQLVTSVDIQRVLRQYFLQQRITLRLLPPWYVRWAKQLLEWLPTSWSDSLEAQVL